MKYLAYALATILLINGLASQPATAPSPGSARVGTFDPRAVAIAYYRSPLHAEHLRALKADHDGSKAAGDTGRAEKLEAQGRAEQELAHRQGFGNGPYDSLAAQLAPVWPTVLGSTDVDVIVPRAFAVRKGVQTVDLTDAILDQLHADQKTRQIIRDLNEKVRTGKYDPARYHD